jgi:DNA polymerase I-like protein with 3'-5' exonuclease and polymerase domains
MRRPTAKPTIPRVITIDFETEPIKRRPLYPPKAVGVAIKYLGQKAKYYSWGHPTKNNCTEKQGIAALKAAYAAVKRGEYDGLLFQNGKFDIDVAETHYGCPRLHWSKYHELQFLLFLNNPHSHNLQLKSQAKELLGIMPEEKDEVTDWLKDTYGTGKSKRTGKMKLPDPRPYLEGREPGVHAKPERVKWYAMGCLAPGDIVGRLAIGDADRTEKLFNHLYLRVTHEAKMMEPYDRLRRFQLIALENEREGIHVDVKLLREDVEKYQKAMETVEAWLRKRLKRPDLNFNSDDDFAQALADNDLVDEDNWTFTKTGKRSVSKKNLTPEMVNDKRVAQAYGYRNRLYTCLHTFMLTWLRQAEATGKATGQFRIHTTWKLVKASSIGGEEGAATGRLSSSPNFQNIPNEWEGRDDGYTHPVWLKVPELPLMRVYIIPDPGDVLGEADYDGQELRLLAHFGDGAPELIQEKPYIGGDPVPGEMLAKYNSDPEYKVHKVVHAGMPSIIGKEFSYKKIKNFDFQVVYGGGVPAVMAALGCDKPTAEKAIAAFKKLLPDYDRLNASIKSIGNSGGYVTTWGGRRYYKEPDHYSLEYQRWMNFCYKLLNYLIQGSAGDCTIEALIRYHEHPKRQARFLITVHDSILISIPKHRVMEEILILVECMESIELDLLLKSEPKTGPRWSETKDFKIERKAA